MDAVLDQRLGKSDVLFSFGTHRATNCIQGRRSVPPQRLTLSSCNCGVITNRFIYLDFSASTITTAYQERCMSAVCSLHDKN